MLYDFTPQMIIGIPDNHDVKLHSISQNQAIIKAFVVECSRLIVNDYQIKVNGCFLDFQIITFGKLSNYKVNIGLIGFRKRELNS